MGVAKGRSGSAKTEGWPLRRKWKAALGTRREISILTPKSLSQLMLTKEIFKCSSRFSTTSMMTTMGCWLPLTSEKLWNNTEATTLLEASSTSPCPTSILMKEEKLASSSSLSWWQPTPAIKTPRTTLIESSPTLTSRTRDLFPPKI